MVFWGSLDKKGCKSGLLNLCKNTADFKHYSLNGGSIRGAPSSTSGSTGCPLWTGLEFRQDFQAVYVEIPHPSCPHDYLSIYSVRTNGPTLCP